MSKHHWQTDWPSKLGIYCMLISIRNLHINNQPSTLNSSREKYRSSFRVGDTSPVGLQKPVRTARLYIVNTGQNSKIFWQIVNTKCSPSMCLSSQETPHPGILSMQCYPVSNMSWPNLAYSYNHTNEELSPSLFVFNLLQQIIMRYSAIKEIKNVLFFRLKKTNNLSIFRIPCFIA